MPDATSVVVPPSGGVGHGCTRPDGAAPSGDRVSVFMLAILPDGAAATAREAYVHSAARRDDRPCVDGLEVLAAHRLQPVEDLVVPPRIERAGDEPAGTVVGHDHSVRLEGAENDLHLGVKR